ncbi:hypothetical protein METHP14_100046 [Pseudomonas sp. P14-2025]
MLASCWPVVQNRRASALPVTVEQFSDTRRVGFPEATPLSVTDNAYTDRDIRRSVGGPPITAP